MQDQTNVVASTTPAGGGDISPAPAGPATSQVVRNGKVGWNPLDNSLDTASMCAMLGINTFFYLTIPSVECSAEDAGDEQTIRYTVSHDGTPEGKEAAWRLAATMVAAKVGGYRE